LHISPKPDNQPRRTLSFFFFFSSSADHRDLHSFPTRRSSDLLELDPEGRIMVSRPPADPRFTVPLSGLYWQISDERERSSWPRRSEEHTSELQSPCNLVCRLLLEKKK